VTDSRLIRDSYNHLTSTERAQVGVGRGGGRSNTIAPRPTCSNVCSNMCSNLINMRKLVNAEMEKILFSGLTVVICVELCEAIWQTHSI